MSSWPYPYVAVVVAEVAAAARRRAPASSSDRQAPVAVARRREDGLDAEALERSPSQSTTAPNGVSGISIRAASISPSSAAPGRRTM